MITVLDSLARYSPAVAVATPVAVPPWKFDGLKDLSPGGLCDTGYGDQSRTHRILQQVSTVKHKEKYFPYLGWGVALIPMVLEAIPEIVYDADGIVPLRDLPGRTHAVLKNKLGRVSTGQLGFLLSAVPLYHNARTIKNSIWTGSGLDPSGHLMFKIVQYGMTLSVATNHGSKSRIAIPVMIYLVVISIADALMLANTFTNCHTVAEVVVGAGLGAVVLLAAHAVGKYTPLGQWAQGIAQFAGKLAGEAGDMAKNAWLGLPKLFMVNA